MVARGIAHGASSLLETPKAEYDGNMTRTNINITHKFWDYTTTKRLGHIFSFK